MISVRLLEIDRTSCNVIFSTRLPYLRWSLAKRYQNEIIFFGSGGIFKYTRREDVGSNLHRELVVMVRRHPVPPAAVENKDSRLMTSVEKTVKPLLGRGDEDLYDLNSWTVHDNRQSAMRRA